MKTPTPIHVPPPTKWHFTALKILLTLALASAVAGCSAEAKKARLLQRAKEYLDAGEYDKAKIEYMNVLRKDAQNVTAIQQLGIIWLEQGASIQAVQFLHRAVQQSPDNAAIRTKLALALLDLGDVDNARKEATTALSKSATQDDAVILLGNTAPKEEFDKTEQELLNLGKPNMAAVHVALSGLSILKGDTSKAEKEVEQALALGPKSIPALLTKGKLSLIKGDLSKAGEAFKAAADLAPIRSEANMTLANFTAGKGAVAEAKSQLQEITRKAPDYLPAWNLQAQIALLAENKPDESLTLLGNVFSRDSHNLWGRLLRAQALLLKGDAKTALPLFDELHKEAPKSPEILYSLAESHWRIGNQDQARIFLNEALAASPDFVKANIFLAQIELGSDKAKTAAQLLETLLQKRPKLSREQYLRILLTLTEAYNSPSLNRTEEAAAMLRTEVKAHPKEPMPFFMLGMTLRLKGDLMEARAAFSRAQELAEELRQEDLAATYQLIVMDIGDKDFKTALQRAEAQIQKHPKMALAQFLEGKVLAAQRDWERAETSVLKALQLDPNSITSYNLLIGIYIASGNMPKAAARLEAQLVNKPDDLVALMALGSIYQSLRGFPKACDAYEKVLSKKPDFVPAMNNLAYLYLQHLNQPEKAYELARKARALDPKEPNVTDTLAWIVYQKGDYQQAFALISDAAGKLPDDPEIQFHLGMAAYMMGKTDVALTSLKRAAAADADFPGKPEIQARLAFLEQGVGANAPMTAANLEAALQKQPGDPVLLTRLAEAYEQAGDIAKAAGAYEKVYQLNPKLIPTIIKLAQLQAGALKNPGKALEFANAARELTPNDPQVARILGALAFQAGDYSKAYGLLHDSAKSMPDDAGVLHDVAWAAYSQGRVDEARQFMDHLLKVAPTSTQADHAASFLALAARSQSAQDLVALSSKADSMLTQDPGYVPALMVRATLQFQSGDMKPAADNYETILRRFPDFAPAQKLLAALYSTDPANLQKGYDLAIKARKVLPDDPDLAETLGVISCQRKEFAYSIQLLQESARKRPLDGKGLYYLGKSFLETKQLQEGRAALDKALAAGLQEPLASDLKAALADLEKK